MNKFFVIVNNSSPGTWAEWIWKDIEQIGKLYLDNSTLTMGSLLCKIKRLHFSNKLNKKIHIPCKSIWNNKLCIQPDDLDMKDRNYIIFQGNIKFSPSYIRWLKKNKNVCLVLYLLDTIEEMGIGSTKNEFDEYCKYYGVDQAYTFDMHDSEMLGIEYFDLYSSASAVYMETGANIAEPGIFYVGSCRNRERLELLHQIFEKLSQQVKCDFYLVGVDKNDQKYDGIVYNHPLNYFEVMQHMASCNCLLELTNKNQTGYTVRFKEAVVHGKKLITNNSYVKKSQYFSEANMCVFKSADDISKDWILSCDKPQYNYSGEFSPLSFVDKIINADNNPKLR